MHASALNDCAGRKMFSAWTPSKRLKVRLPSAAALSGLNLWFGMLDLHETEVLPLTNNLSPSALAVRLRRWRAE